MREDGLHVRLTCTSWEQLRSIHGQDLSRGILFLQTSAAPPLGAALRIALCLPSGSSVLFHGYCHQHLGPDPVQGRAAGVEIRLDSIPQSALWLIESALRAAGLAESPAPGVATTAAPLMRKNIDLEDGRPVTLAEDDLVIALQAELASMRKLTPFQVLGVEFPSNDEAVRAAFGRLTKRYHPDRFARYDSGEIRALAAEIFILIRDAYRKLVDGAGRKASLDRLQERPAAGKPAGAGATGAPPALAAGSGVSTTAKDGSAPPISGPYFSPAPSGPPHPARPAARAPSPSLSTARAGTDPSASANAAATEIDRLLDAGRFDEALEIYRGAALRRPDDRALKANINLIKGLRALATGDRMTAAECLEMTLEVDPDNPRAAMALAELRRLATEERRSHLARLLGKNA